jgi:hypothetical protein
MHINNEIWKRYPKFVIATTAVITSVMLLGTTAISTITTAGSVFAYRNSQASSQINDCGNGELPLNVGCQNTDSQIQGDDNTAALASQQTFPPANPCVACFKPLSGEERAAFEKRIGGELTGGQASTIEGLCAFLETLDLQEQEFTIRGVAEELVFIGVDEPTVDNIIGCLRSVLGLPPTT